MIPLLRHALKELYPPTYLLLPSIGMFHEDTKHFSDKDVLIYYLFPKKAEHPYFTKSTIDAIYDSMLKIDKDSFMIPHFGIHYIKYDEKKAKELLYRGLKEQENDFNFIQSMLKLKEPPIQITELIQKAEKFPYDLLGAKENGNFFYTQALYRLIEQKDFKTAAEIEAKIRRVARFN